mgnify:CR=1 FL=1
MSLTGRGREAVQRRILTVLILGQLLAGAGLAAGVTVGALLAEDLLRGLRTQVRCGAESTTPVG